MCCKERSRMLVLAVLSGLVMELLFWGGFGFSVPVVVVFYYGVVVWQCRMVGGWKRVMWHPLFLGVMLTTLCFGLFDNGVLKFFNSIFLYFLMVLHVSEVFEVNRYEAYSPRWFVNMLPMGVIMPFGKMGDALRAARKEGDGTRSQKWDTVKKILIGCAIALPMLIVTVALLMSADAAFEGTINFALRGIDFEFGELIGRGITFCIVFFPMLGFFYGMVHPAIENVKPSKSTEDGSEIKARGIDFIIAMTVVTLLSVVYLLYCFSQLSYFVSAFSGILPKDYTYAEYARRGFFEMLPIAGLNLGIVAILNLFTQGKEERNKRLWIKAYTFFVIGFTVFIILTALSKMVMYMGTYGLTIKRVYVTWFLVLCLISLGLIVLKILREKFKLTKGLAILFVVMYLGLNYANMDYQIARYNADLYIDKGVETTESFVSLSLSATGPFLETKVWKKAEHAYLLDIYKDRAMRGDWRQWNMAYLRASKLLDSK